MQSFQDFWSGLTLLGLSNQCNGPKSKLKTFIQMISIAILLTGESGNKIINFQIDKFEKLIGIPITIKEIDKIWNNNLHDLKQLLWNICFSYDKALLA